MEGKDAIRTKAIGPKQPAINILFGGLGLCGLYLVSLNNYLLFHGLAEIFSIVVACGIFMIGWNARPFLENSYFPSLGIAYLFVGGLDFIHMLAYSGMGVFPAYGANLPTQLWIASRYIESFSLLIFPLLIHVKHRLSWVTFCYTAITTLLLGTIFYWDIFPTCFVEGSGLTPFKKFSEYGICLILSAAVFLLLKKRSAFDDGVLRLLVASVVATILAELAFTFYISAYGFSNAIGHLLKILSFFLIYKAVIETGLTKPYNLLYRDLQKSEVRNRAILQALPDLMFVLSRDGVHLDFFASSSDQLLIQSEDFLNKCVDDTLPEDVAETCRYHIQQCLDSREMQTFEYQLGFPDGTTRAFEARMVASGDDQVLTIVRNITDRKQLEEELVRTQRLRAAGELSAGISHNLNNILSGILGPAQLLKRMTEDPDILQETDQIISSAWRARDLVHRLHLSVRGIQDDRLRSVSINEIAQEAIRMTSPRWKDEPESRGVDIKILTQFGEIPPIQGTESGLHEIFTNLIFNAVDAMPQGGTISIESRVVEESVQITFGDTGIGMDGETRNRVFEPFFTTKMDIGTGLGLSTVYNTVELWGGEIELESTPDKGTRFTFCFPTWKEEKTEEKREPEKRQIRPGKVLVIDDDEGICSVLARMLGKVHEVETITDGRRALEQFTPGRYDVVLIDLGMSGMSGDRVAEELRSRDPLISTVLITGWELSEDDPRRDPFDFQMMKPFGSLDEVRDVAARGIELHNQRSGKSR
jgi:PAS domain S-box-containing protein